MSITKYKTNYSKNSIIAVEIERETESFVWVGGNRQAKAATFAVFHGSWDEAHAYLMGEAERQVKSARVRLDQANGVLGNIKGMKRFTPKAAA